MLRGRVATAPRFWFTLPTCPWEAEYVLEATIYGASQGRRHDEPLFGTALVLCSSCSALVGFVLLLRFLGYAELPLSTVQSEARLVEEREAMGRLLTVIYFAPTVRSGRIHAVVLALHDLLELDASVVDHSRVAPLAAVSGTSCFLDAAGFQCGCSSQRTLTTDDPSPRNACSIHS